MSAPARDSDVRIAIPADADYVVLARLALSAICRLTTLGHMDVADLKLAATEAASLFLAEGDADTSIEFSIRLRDERIEVELRGRAGEVPDDERELSQAILAATVDTLELDSDRALLVKRLPA